MHVDTDSNEYRILVKEDTTFHSARENDCGNHNLLRLLVLVV